MLANLYLHVGLNTDIIHLNPTYATYASGGDVEYILLMTDGQMNDRQHAITLTRIGTASDELANFELHKELCFLYISVSSVTLIKSCESYHRLYLSLFSPRKSKFILNLWKTDFYSLKVLTEMHKSVLD